MRRVAIVLALCLALTGCRRTLLEPDPDGAPGDVGVIDIRPSGPGPDGYFVPPADASVPSAFGWAVSGGSYLDDKINDVALDSAGNSYVTGATGAGGGPAAFGHVSIDAREPMYVARIDAKGDVMWATTAVSGFFIEGLAIAADGAGNSYVTGHFVSSWATLGTFKLDGSPGGGAIFVAKLDSKGVYRWATAVKPALFGTLRPTAIAADKAGHTFVTGFYNGSVTFGATNLTAKGGHDLFVARLDSQGNLAWAVSAGGTTDDEASGLDLDSAGNLYVTGTFHGQASFGATTLTSKGSSDLFVAKLDSGGKWLWAYGAGGPASDEGRAIAVDGAGNSRVTGTFSGTASFGALSLPGTGSYGTFVSGLSPAGTFGWAVEVAAGGGPAQLADSIAVDGAGCSYLAASFDKQATIGGFAVTAPGYDLAVLKLSAAGKKLWIAPARAGGSGERAASAIAVDGSGNAVMAGTFSGQAGLGGKTLTARGGDDVLVTRVDRSGKP